jgi:hypothetical protein
VFKLNFFYVAPKSDVILRHNIDVYKKSLCLTGDITRSIPLHDNKINFSGFQTSELLGTLLKFKKFYKTKTFTLQNEKIHDEDKLL